MVFLIYVLLAVVLTYPLILHIGSHVPGDGRDDPPLVWNLWWVRYALTELHTNPLTCLYMFYPIGINLTFYTLTILNGLLSIPLQLISGVIVANNVGLLASYCIAAFGMYLLTLDLLNRSSQSCGCDLHLAAFIAGLVYAFAPIKMIFASLGQFNMASTQWLPFYVLYLLRLTTPSQDKESFFTNKWCFRFWLCGDWHGRRTAIMGAFFLLFTAYAEFTFASFLAIFTVIYAAYLLTRRRTYINQHVMGRFVLLVITFIIGFSPILVSMLSEIAHEGDYSLTPGWGFADVFAADLLGFFIPSHLHPIFGSWAQQATKSFSYTNFASLGWVALVLALVGIMARRHFRSGYSAPPIAFWGGSSLLYAILSLGPVLHIGGRWVFDLDGLVIRVPLPFIILHYIPLIKANRYPSRLQVLVILCLAILVAYGVAWLSNGTRINPEHPPSWIQANRSSFHDRSRSISIRRCFMVGLLTLSILFEYLAIPLPMSDMRVPEVYSRIAQDNNHAPVLQLPISWRNSFQFIPQRLTELPQSVSTVVMFQQFYQSTHQGPILSGNTSRNPEFKLTYFLEAPIIRSIVALEEGRTISQEQVTYDRSIAQDILHFFGFKYIVVHPPLVGGPVEEYIRTVFPVEPIPADPGLSAYRVLSPAPTERLVIDMASDLSRLYRAEGWGEPQQIAGRMARWTDRPHARLLLPLPESRTAELLIEAMSPQPDNSVSVWLNGHRILTTNIETEWSTLRIRLPEGVTRRGLNELTIAPSAMTPLPLATAGQQSVGQTSITVAANIVVHSAGLDAGGDLGFAHIYVNGEDLIKARRGINLAVINASTGQVEQRAHFDLLADVANDRRFLDFIKAVPDGRAVAVAVMDDASINFGDNSREALRLIGAQADLRGCFRTSYAALGIKGAVPGQALEQWAQGRPASVAVGAHVFGHNLGIAVSRVAIETVQP